MVKKYEKPEMTIEKFMLNSVITESNTGLSNGVGDGDSIDLEDIFDITGM